MDSKINETTAVAAQNKAVEQIAASLRQENRLCFYYISTFGCQMNAHDSEKLADMLRRMGYREAPEEALADLILYNTCCVRENAENKVYGNLGYLKHMKEKRPDLKIVLCGCMMQQETVIEKIRQSYRHVDIIFGTHNLHRLPELLLLNKTSGEPVIDIWQERKDGVEEAAFDAIENAPPARKRPFMASVNIMYGCDNFCTYCVVPYVRGRERSRASGDILKEIRALAAGGVREVLLLGQNVNSYGNTLSQSITFAALLRQITQIEGIERIRFMTSHPKDLSDDLIETIRDNPKICDCIHLPFQAGSTDVLRRMNRKYTKEQYLDLIGRIKQAIPKVAITTDIIVGFPGETESDFLETLDIVQKVRFNGAFTFLYSKRTGTPAALMPDQVPESTAKERFNRLLAVLNPIILQKNQEQIGRTLAVLLEGVSENNGFLTGRADDYSLVHVNAPATQIGQIIQTRIVDCKTFYLIGEPAERI